VIGGALADEAARSGEERGKELGGLVAAVFGLEVFALPNAYRAKPGSGI
jgi:hypothetical protein